MKYDTPIKRKTNRAKKKKFNDNVKYITLLAVIIVTQLINTGNDNAIMIMLTDIADQANYIRQEVETPDMTSENRSQVNLGASDRALIERVVMSESGDEGLQAQMAVAQTIFDRSHDWGIPIAAVVNQTGIYSTKDNGEPTDSVKLAVANVFDGGMRVYEGGTYQFHDDTVKPYWTEGKVCRGSIGNLSFYGGYEQAR